MVNGQQLFQQNIDAFKLLVASQSDEDLNQIVIRSHLDRKEFAKGVGCGKSALNQNPALWESLENLEDALREVDFFEI